MKRSLKAVVLLVVAALLLLCGGAHAQEVQKVEVGVHYTSLTISTPRGFRTETEPGVGARVTFNLTDSLALEAEGNFYPRESFPNNSTGGVPSQLQAGLKAGKRFERWGIFAKARPGVVSFSRVRHFTGTEAIAIGDQTFIIGVSDDKRRSYFSMDVGAVVEFYHSRRFFTRFDLGDTVIRYGRRTDQFFTGTQARIITIPPETRHNFQFNAGIGFRF